MMPQAKARTETEIAQHVVNARSAQLEILDRGVPDQLMLLMRTHERPNLSLALVLDRDEIAALRDHLTDFLKGEF